MELLFVIGSGLRWFEAASGESGQCPEDDLRPGVIFGSSEGAWPAFREGKMPAPECDSTQPTATAFTRTVIQNTI
jgi:hypothetical protein